MNKGTLNILNKALWCRTRIGRAIAQNQGAWATLEKLPSLTSKSSYEFVYVFDEAPKDAGCV
jgi:hypothetical protein